MNLIKLLLLLLSLSSPPSSSLYTVWYSIIALRSFTLALNDDFFVYLYHATDSSVIQINPPSPHTHSWDGQTTTLLYCGLWHPVGIYKIFWENSAFIFRVMNCRVPRAAATRKQKGGRKWGVCHRPGGNEKRIQNFSRQISYDKSPSRWYCRRESNKYYSRSYTYCLRLWSGLNWTRRETYNGVFDNEMKCSGFSKTACPKDKDLGKFEVGRRKIRSCRAGDFHRTALEMSAPSSSEWRCGHGSLRNGAF